MDGTWSSTQFRCVYLITILSERDYLPRPVTFSRHRRTLLALRRVSALLRRRSALVVAREQRRPEAAVVASLTVGMWSSARTTEDMALGTNTDMFPEMVLVLRLMKHA